MAQGRYRGTRSRSGYARSGYGSRGRSYSSRARAAPRRKRPASGGGRRTGRAAQQTVRLVIEQVPASAVSRPQLGLLNTMLKAAPKAPTKAKL